MRNMKKFGRAVSKISKKSIAIAIAFAMSLPNATYAEETQIPETSDVSSRQEESFYVTPEEHIQEIIDEARALNVPDAFIRHYLASDLQDEKIAAFDKNMSVVTNDEGVEGVEIKSVKLTKFANNKIDLGNFDFGDYKAGNMVYNFIASRKLKGKAYLYTEKSEDPIATFEIKRTVDDSWGKTKNLAVDVRKANLTGEQHLYLKVVPDSVLNTDGTINESASGKGSLYLESLFFTEGSTPVVSFDIDKEFNTVEDINGSEYHTTMGYGTMNIQVPDGYKSPVSDEVLTDKSYDLDYVRGRGNSTWKQIKKPYKVKLDKSETVLGMPKNKHWGLVANYFDYTLLRNRYTFYLAEQLGLEYTPHSVAVDVVMDGEYYGSYQFAETVRIDENRVDIGDLEEDPSDVTGGYLLQHMASWLTDEKLPSVGNPKGTHLVIEKPEYGEDCDEDIKQAQIDYMDGFLRSIDDAVNTVSNEDGNESDELVNWRDLLDEDSLIKYTLMQDFSLNGDAYGGSTYYYKPRGEKEKLYCGPVWDFDFVAWGAYKTDFENPHVDKIEREDVENLDATAKDGNETLTEENNEEDNIGVKTFGPMLYAPWFMKLYSGDEEFKANVIKIWNDFSNILKESAKDGGVIDQMAKETYMSALANYQVTTSYLIDGVDYWSGEGIPMYSNDGSKYTLNYYNEINRLKSYVNNRALWVDGHLEDIENNVDSSWKNVVLDDVEFYVDDQLYATAPLDWIVIDRENIPENPEKEGYFFVGWYYKNADGEELKFDPEDIQVSIIADEMGEQLGFSTKKYYAKFIPVSEVPKADSFKFVRDTVYVPMNIDLGEGGNDGYAVGNVTEDLEDYEGDDLNEGYSRADFDAKDLLKIVPFDVNPEDIKFELVDEKGNPVGEYKADLEFDNDSEEFNEEYAKIDVSRNGFVTVNDLGDYYIKATYLDKSAVLKISVIEGSEAVYPKELTVDKEVKLNVDEYGDINFKYDVEENIPYYYFTDIRFKALDKSMVEFESCGTFKAKKAGETSVISYIEGDDEMLMDVTKVIVSEKNANKPSQTMKKDIKSDEKRAPKKGTKLTDKTYIYKITKEASDDGKKAGEVEVTKLFKKNLKKATVKSTVTIDGFKYDVTSIGSKAFTNHKKLTKVTIGKNVERIGTKAFFKLKKLTKVVINSNKLPKFGKKVFVKKGKKLTIKVNKKLIKKAKKALKKAKCKGYKVK
ncbi:CotH kinase family protein [Eubacterium sp.]|uniref:CotH kinase family protein n=1 Tax=Eubacterium sp. TaxID=142586 RepID=UPI0025CEC3D8|nr:CotH kinase family protein [Eubacterium sp.]MCR5628417.1 CotH kinase family protein [Eubacterium sp.]